MRYQGYFRVFAYCLGLLCVVIISHNSANAQAKRYEIQCSEKLWNASYDSVLSQIGLVELTGNNDGKHVVKYLKSVGLKGRLPYCYAGQYWAFYVAADKLQETVTLLKTALAAAAFNNAARVGTKTKPIPQLKDLIFWKFSQKVNGHAARIVKIKKAGWIVTAEFNTPSGIAGDQREGGGNHKRNRNIKYPLSRMNLSGFIGRKS
ncbi:MAG: hypothetical protein IPM69_14905 [Ignavibacteria bacterium]|nr:hypothetical protein [Ignavibacteria bacterium]